MERRYETTGERIAQLIEATGLTVEEVAAKAGLTTETVERVKDDWFPIPEIGERLADAFEIRLDVLHPSYQGADWETICRIREFAESRTLEKDIRWRLFQEVKSISTRDGEPVDMPVIEYQYDLLARAQAARRQSSWTLCPQCKRSIPNRRSVCPRCGPWIDPLG